MKLIESISEASKCLEEFLAQEDLGRKLEEASALMVQSFKQDRMVISCGNGGSTCDAMHFAEELTGRYRKNRRALPAMALADPSYLTCVSNDFGYSQSFARGVEAYGRENGVLLAISTSGNSENVIQAATLALDLKMKVIGLTGASGGKLSELSTVHFACPGNTTDRIQELHIKVIHTLIEGIERELFPENYA